MLHQLILLHALLHVDARLSAARVQALDGKFVHVPDLHSHARQHACFVAPLHDVFLVLAVRE